MEQLINATGNSNHGTITITKNQLHLGLPSHVQIDEYVDFKAGVSGKIRAARVIAVHFSPGKVAYDLEITVEYGETKKYYTRIHNVDSAFCIKRTDEYLDSEYPENKKEPNRDEINNGHSCPRALWKKMSYKQRIVYNNMRTYGPSFTIPTFKKKLTIAEYDSLSHNFAYLAATEHA